MELKHIQMTASTNQANLLIVPYGIETKQKVRVLLIVFRLLIVPYGIETIDDISSVKPYTTFNRTLWN